MTDTAFYNDMTATALELLTDFGQSITLTAPPNNQGGYDDAGNPLLESPGVTCSGVALKGDYKGSEIQSDSTGIVSGDCYLMLKTSSGTPTVGMTTPWNGAIWRVMGVSPAEYGGIITHHKLQIRR